MIKKFKSNIWIHRTLFLFSSKRGSPYKSISFLTLSDNELKFSEMDFTLFIGTIRFWENHGSAESIEMYFQSPN